MAPAGAGLRRERFARPPTTDQPPRHFLGASVWPLLSSVLPAGAKFLRSGRWVKGLPGAKRRDAAAGSDLDAAAASWTIGSREGRDPALHRPALPGRA